MNVRVEKDSDFEAINAVHFSAFETFSEADLVVALRQQVSPIVSMVAEVKQEVVGHVIFSPVELASYPDIRIMGLGPMAVSAPCQRMGIGSALVKHGLDQCKQIGCEVVVVLGHPSYYPRFGFLPASRFCICSEYDVPDEVFMAMELKPNSLNGKKGKVRYAAPFASL